MLANSNRLFVLVLFTAAASLGAEGDGCQGPDEADTANVCELNCEHGRKTDLDGRVYCQCRDGEGCPQPGLSAHANPVTGACIPFGDACDVPNNWQVCDDNTTCWHNDVEYEVGASFPAGDGCNDCTCDSEGQVICTLAECSDRCSLFSETECISDPGCEPTYQSDTSTNCAPADNGDRPANCLEYVGCSDAALLCDATGGTWHDGGCGHWYCGLELLCGMISTPGCDCGVGRNYVAGSGCVADVSCGVQCEYGGTVYGIGDTFPSLDGCNSCTCTDQGIPCTEMACSCGDLGGCGSGSVCNDCPADPDCPMCTVCGPPICEPLVCVTDADCPTDSFCNYCPESPAGVGCDWIGDPPTQALCTPGTRGVFP